MTIRFRCLYLIWRPAGIVVRFVAVNHLIREQIFLMCTDVTMISWRSLKSTVFASRSSCLSNRPSVCRALVVIEDARRFKSGKGYLCLIEK